MARWGNKSERKNGRKNRRNFGILNHVNVVHYGGYIIDLLETICHTYTVNTLTYDIQNHLDAKTLCEIPEEHHRG